MNKGALAFVRANELRVSDYEFISYYFEPFTQAHFPFLCRFARTIKACIVSYYPTCEESMIVQEVFQHSSILRIYFSSPNNISQMRIQPHVTPWSLKASRAKHSSLLRGSGKVQKAVLSALSDTNERKFIGLGCEENELTGQGPGSFAPQ